MALIYIVEDDVNIREIETFSLKNSGYTVMDFECAKDFYHKLSDKVPDLILLDIMLPKMNGFEVCQQIREFSSVPIVMLTAKGDDMDKILGLEYGADDYITKPYNPMELVARVRSNLRRYMQLGAIDTANKTDIIEIGGLELDTKAKSLKVDGEPVKLTATELKILELLMKNAGRIFSAEEIYSKVWNEDAYAVENTVMVHIRHIREKIEINPREPKYLKVVWGIGYKIEKI